jgi:hypothetical protein
MSLQEIAEEINRLSQKYVSIEPVDRIGFAPTEYREAQS